MNCARPPGRECDTWRAMQTARGGVLAAVTAFVLWGLLPLFWKALDFLPPLVIVAQRTLWSLVLLWIIILWRRRGREVLAGLANRRDALWNGIAALLLGTNWLLYVWATLNDRIIEGALGYYLNPFFNILFGMWWFGERYNRTQYTAIGLALCGVALQVPAVRGFPWVALVLAVTFSLYGVVRKRAAAGALTGLTMETTLLAPLALALLAVRVADPVEAFGGSWANVWLVAAAGAATVAPLWCFGHAARTIRLSTLGILQFIGPTLQFLIGWQLYGEPMGALRLASFGLIWAAVALYALDAWCRGGRDAHATRPAPPPGVRGSG
jgi:chloramphenicol-sensitive protein RarD